MMRGWMMLSMWLAICSLSWSPIMSVVQAELTTATPGNVESTSPSLGLGSLTEESGPAINQTLTLMLLVPPLGQRFASAIIPGLAEVERRGLLPGYNITWTWRDTGCNANSGFRAAIDGWLKTDNVSGIIGGSCSIVCEPVGLLAAAWNIPMVSFGCSSGVLSDTTQYPTFFRTMGVVRSSYVARGMMMEFGWDRVAIIATNQQLHYTLAQEAKRVVEEFGYTAYYHICSPIRFGDQVDADAVEEMLQVVRMVKDEARFVTIFMYTEDTRSFMVHAYNEGMLGTGEYIFLTNEMYHERLTAFIPLHQPELSLATLFEGVMTIMPQLVDGPLWEQLTEDIVEGFDDPQFDGYNHINDPNEAHSFGGYLHDAILLWAYGVNKTLRSGGSAVDGVQIASEVQGLSYQDGVTGDVTIDEHGDRMLDRTIYIMQPDQQVDFYLVHIFQWHAVEDQLVRVYEPETAPDWQGLLWGGGSTSVPTGVPACGWQGEFCTQPQPNITTPLSLGILAGVVLVAGSLLGVYMAYRQRLRAGQLEEIRRCFVDISRIRPCGESRGQFEENSTWDDPQTAQLQPGGTRKAYLDNTRVALRVYTGVRPAAVGGNAQFLKEIGELKGMQCRHLQSFVGIAIALPKVIILTSYSTKGSIFDLINGGVTRFSSDMKVSLICDIIRGLRFLHKRACMCHGHLTSTNCIVSSRWQCKITDYGLAEIRGRNHILELDDELKLWMAPEILRGQTGPSMEGDVFGFGVIIQEIMMFCQPYACNEPHLSTADILVNVRDVPSLPIYRPQLEQGSCSEDWLDLAAACWSEDPCNRPDSTQILELIIDINGGSLPRLVDSMITNLERHSQTLEHCVEQRSQELHEERSRMDALLKELLPPSIVTALASGATVQPETFDEVTLFFFDIVGFTQLSVLCTPLQLVQMLNSLYSQFDDILQRYDVYKVVTIGDAYFVSSGAPQRNGERHASEIAGMSLDMLELIKEFDVPFLPDKRLYLRIGLHTGACVGGVTGSKTPRYHLFGESVNIANYMESNGEAMRIQVSYTTADILMEDGRFDLQPRGQVRIKGIGEIRTHWLLGRRQACDGSQIDNSESM